jgi:hypothetical protein
MSQVPPDPELKAIESALGELIPVSSRLDRDKLMFQAGAMSKPAARGRFTWPAITAALSLALAGESLFLGSRPAPQVVERIVFMPVPAPTDAVVPAAQREPRPPGFANGDFGAPASLSVASSSGASDYQRFQNLVIRFGFDAFPERPAVVSREDVGGISPGFGLKPAGALRSLELERILKPGDPS